MKQIRMLAQYYVDLMMKLGLVRFSMLLALALVVLAIVVQMAVTMVLHGQVESIDVIRSIFFGLLITPWAVYFCRWWWSNWKSRGSVFPAGGKTGGDARARSAA
jgi:hypothetical protein